jgi:hypothetical protein
MTIAPQMLTEKSFNADLDNKEKTMNLLKETKEAIRKKGYTFPDGVKAIQSKGLRISVRRFTELAQETEYDNGYGSAVIAKDLVILMEDGTWFERGEYDGAEWWRYVKPPAVVDRWADDKVKRLAASPEQIGWMTLAEMNGIEEKEKEDEH